MTRIFISRRYSDNPVGSRASAAVLARCLALKGHIPLAPQIYLPQFIHEASERGLALKLCLALVALSDEIRVFGEISPGMRLEIAEARRLGIPVIGGDWEGEQALTGEPPR